MSTPEPLAAELERLVRREQRDKRLPSIAAAVVRDGETIWETAVGAADVTAARESTPDTQYRLGSITKTFTAAAVMQLRDAGKLDLEDTLDVHIPGAAHRPTLRRLLSHTSGIQRETQDDAWLSRRFAPAEELVATLGDAEQVLPPGARFHYSNLAFALLGIVVERASGQPYADYVRTRLLEPLGLRRITFEPEEPAAVGYLVEDYVEGVARRGPGRDRWLDLGGPDVGDGTRPEPLGRIPCSAGRVGACAHDGRGDADAADRSTTTSAGPAATGSGSGLRRDGERILAGHGGCDAGLHRRRTRLAHGQDRRSGADELERSRRRAARRHARRAHRRRVAGRAGAVAASRRRHPTMSSRCSASGGSEGSQIVFRWRDGKLEGRFDGVPDWRASSVYEREADDLWRTVSGPEHGELLRIERDAGGEIVRLVWAGYPITREPSAMA